MCKKIVLFLITMICLAVSAGAASKQFTLVIDAGHGGHDTGAIGKGKVKEKNLTLKFALAFGRLVEQNCPDVRVIYTRKTDRFVELYRRAEIANNAKADLFISIHINSVERGIVRGFQTYTLGRSRRTGKKNGVMENLEVAKRENAVIYLERDYKQTYHGYDPNSPESNIMFEFIQDKNMENSVELAKYMQRYVCQATNRQDQGAHQDNLAVLRLTSMPGCLIELGFISTPDEEQYMNSNAATAAYARGIYNAFAAYKKKHGGSITVPYLPEPKADRVEIPQVVPQSAAADKAKSKAEENSAAPKEEPMAEPKTQQEKKEAEGQTENTQAPDGVDLSVVGDDTPAKAEPAEAKARVEAKQPVEAKQQSPAPTDAPVFKVQILVSTTKLKSSDRQLKGQKSATFYREGGMYKYTLGASTDYNEIYRLRKSILDDFPEAFIIAFRGDAKMNVQEAIREFKKNRVK